MAWPEYGKKVFFVYPHSVVEDNLKEELINREYEVYLIKDHRKIELICEYYTSPVIFINIDDGLKEPEWEDLIRSLQEKESTKHARIGILSYNDNPELSRKYLMDLAIPAGFIKLKLGIKESQKILLGTLEANEVKGSRKFVRATCDPGEAHFNVDVFDHIRKGTIVDISSVGMAVSFDDDDVDLQKNAYLKNIQLKLKGVLVTVNAVVMGFRKETGEKTLYVLMFESQMPIRNRSKIRSFIQRTLQNKMEKKLNIQYV